MNLATLTELTKLAKRHGWYPTGGYSPRDGDWLWLNLTSPAGTHLDIEWEPGLPTGCQIHASTLTGPRVTINCRSLDLIRRAITDPAWVDHVTVMRDSDGPTIDLRVA
jgi:hypothetical protein